ncbi:MAG: hypothetical protein ACLVGL_01760 [Waltera sp.]
MKSFCVSYFRHPTADGTAVPESISNVWMIRLPEITYSCWTASTPLLLETNKGHDLTIDTELEWGTDSEIMNWNTVCDDTGNSKSSA